MELLVKHELIYGQLMDITEPHLVERYNKALAAFGLPQTELTSFRIDMTGFSPEVADILGDPQYLDPNGVNRRFIILTPAQERLPVVHTSFSNTGALMHQFFEANRRAINAVTIRDVLYGEIGEGVVRGCRHRGSAVHPGGELQRVLTADDMLGKAEELRELCDRLLERPDAWRDDAMIERMVELAGQTGDIRQNALVPEKVVFRHDAFWSGHFGGIFVFLDDKRSTTVICDPKAPGFRRSRPWQVSYIPLDDHEHIYDFLLNSGRIELPHASWMEAVRVSRSPNRQHAAAVADPQNMTTTCVSSGSTGSGCRPGSTAMPATVDRGTGVIPFLQSAERQLRSDGTYPIEEADFADRFVLLRAKPDHEDCWLTNRLLSTLVPSRFRHPVRVRQTRILRRIRNLQRRRFAPMS